MKKEPVFLLLWLILPTPLDAHGAGRVPTIDQLIQLKTLNSAVLSPDGRWVAYRVNGADFQKDVYRGQLWLVEVETGQPFQLTRGEDSVSGAQWSPDGNWLAFTRPHQKKDQIFAIRPGGGEAIATEPGSPRSQWVCLVRRRQVDRLLVRRSRAGGAQGPKPAVGRLLGGPQGLSLSPSLDAGGGQGAQETQKRRPTDRGTGI